MLNDYNNKIASESDSELKRIEKALEENQRKISNIFSFIMDKGLSADIAEVDLTRLYEEKRFLERQHKEIEDKNTSNAISEAIVKELIAKSSEFIKTKKLSECRNFITSYIDKVIVYENKVEVIFRLKTLNNETGEFGPMKSEATRKSLIKRYKLPRKGFTTANTGQY